MKVARSKDGFDFLSVCVSVSAESWGENMRHELLFFTVIEETSSTSKLQSGHIWSVELKTRGSVPVSRYWRASAWLTRAMAHRSPRAALPRTVRFCMFTSPPYLSFVRILSVLVDEDTSQVSSFHSLMEECMPRAPERRGGEPMHSDSSVKHEKWLLAVPDAAGYPHPVHCALEKKVRDVHACIPARQCVFMCFARFLKHL